MAELERIKKERAEEKAKKEEQEQEKQVFSFIFPLWDYFQEQIRLDNILHANPLLTPSGTNGESGNFKVKRRWDDDVVFRNCAKGIFLIIQLVAFLGLDERKKDSTFINDAIRSEFHKKFMEKYIKWFPDTLNYFQMNL